MWRFFLHLCLFLVYTSLYHNYQMATVACIKIMKSVLSQCSNVNSYFYPALHSVHPSLLSCFCVFAYKQIPFHFLVSASSERRVLLPGEVWRKPLQHVSLSEVQLVCRAEEKRPPQSGAGHTPRAEGHLFPAEGCRRHVKQDVTGNVDTDNMHIYSEMLCEAGDSTVCFHINNLYISVFHSFMQDTYDLTILLHVKSLYMVIYA